MRTYLSFETPVAEIDARIDELRALAAKGEVAGHQRGGRQARGKSPLKTLGRPLCGADAVAEDAGGAHPSRPHFCDYVEALITDFTPLSGDRKFGEDAAIVGGFGRFRGERDLHHRPREGRRHRKPAASTISAWRGPKAIARRCG